MIPTRLHMLLLAAVAAFTFMLHLGALDIMPPDEPRYAQVSREMLESGNYLSPTLNGEAYKEKPPMLFWLSSAFGHATGDVDPWAARLPSALGAVAVVLLTYAIARRMFSADLALFAAFVLLTTSRFWWQARVGQIDMLLTAFVTAAIYALWRWHEQRRTRDLVLFYAMLTLGMLTKGPPALVFPLLLIVAFYWGKPEERRKTHWVLGVIAVAALFLLWLVPARMGATGHDVSGGSEASASGEFLKQTLGRVLLGVSKAEWPWYYVLHLPKDLLPWTLLLPWALPVVWRARKRDGAMRFLWAWVLPSFVFFTISVAKRETYILPMYPALAILIAVGVREACAGALSPAWRFRLTLFWGAALLACAVVPWLIKKPEGLGHVQVAIAAVSLAAGISGLDAFRRAAARRFEGMNWMFAVHAFAVLTFAVPALLTMYNAKYSVRGFCAPVAAAAERGEDFDLYSLALFREELRYYCDHPQIEVLMDALETEDSGTLSGLKAQADLRTKMRKTMGALNLKDTSTFVEDDQKQLAEALAGFVANAKHKDETESLLAALKTELDRFQGGFEGPKKALCIVEERDWRWLRAVEPEFAKWRIVSRRELPDRTLYLIANGAGAALLN